MATLGHTNNRVAIERLPTDITGVILLLLHLLMLFLPLLLLSLTLLLRLPLSLPLSLQLQLLPGTATKTTILTLSVKTMEIKESNLSRLPSKSYSGRGGVRYIYPLSSILK